PSRVSRKVRRSAIRSGGFTIRRDSPTSPFRPFAKASTRTPQIRSLLITSVLHISRVATRFKENDHSNERCSSNPISRGQRKRDAPLEQATNQSGTPIKPV